MAMAMMNPPMYKKMYLCPKDAVVVPRSNPPDKGKRTMGNKDVTAIGIASVIHQMATHAVDASMALPSSERPSGLKNDKIRIKANGPKRKPMRLVGFI